MTSADEIRARIQLKEIQESVYFIKDESGNILSRNHDIQNDMFLEDKLFPVQGELGEHFDAHGITKASISEQFAMLHNLLTEGIDPSRPFYTAPYSITDEKRALMGAALGTSGGECYKEGLFVLVGDYDKPIADNGIKYVVINKPLYSQAQTLQQIYPNVEFVKMKDFNKKLQSEHGDLLSEKESAKKIEKLLTYNNVYYEERSKNIVFIPRKGIDEMDAYHSLTDAGLHLELGAKDGNKRYFTANIKDEENKAIKDKITKCLNSSITIQKER